MSEIIRDQIQIKNALKEACELPFGLSFVKIFINYANLQTLEYQNRGIIPPSQIKRHYFSADIEDPNLPLSMILQVSPATDDLTLEIYHGLRSDREYYSNGWFGLVVSNIAGIWAYGRGNLCTKAIRVNFPNDICLPTSSARWFFGFLDNASKTIGEFIDKDIHELPKFWDGFAGELDDDYL